MVTDVQRPLSLRSPINPHEQDRFGQERRRLLLRLPNTGQREETALAPGLRDSLGPERTFWH